MELVGSALVKGPMMSCRWAGIDPHHYPHPDACCNAMRILPAPKEWKRPSDVRLSVHCMHNPSPFAQP
eukprot:1138966-Pelagomonas_calceolata.AAC.1